MATRKLEVVITGDASQLERELGKTGKQSSGLAKNLGKAGLAGAVVGLGAAVKIGVGEFMEAQKVTAQTNAVIKSTGGVANVSTKAIQGLSESLMKKSGVDDEAIQSGANMLLTFTKVRNEVGKGNKIFDQATKLTLDMSVAMGKDMSSSAVLVGKALNDPIKGISALSRVGVQLSETQKDLIKDMVASGDTMGAQKIILSELETQFGGSAEAAGKTFAGQINIARERLNNFAGSVVEKSIPVLQNLARVVNENLVPAFKSIVGWVREHIVPVLQRLWEVGQQTWQGIARVLRENEEPISRVMGALQKLGEMGLWLVNNVAIPVLKPLFTTVLPVALGLTIDALDSLVRFVGKVRDGFVWLRDKGGAAIDKVWAIAEKPLGKLKDAFEFWLTPLQKIIDGIKWLIDNIPKIPKIPGLGGTSKEEFNQFAQGDAHQTGGVNLMGASPVMAPFAAVAAAHGLAVSSGLRPGARTRHGTLSDHALGKALDLAGPASAMASFFKSLVGNASVRQAFYDPLGSIFGGAWSSYREGGHSDHVHVATYDKGGMLQPGWTMAYNGTGRPEPVGGGSVTIPVSIGGELVATIVWDAVRQKAKVFERQNGRSAFA